MSKSKNKYDWVLPSAKPEISEFDTQFFGTIRIKEPRAIDCVRAQNFAKEHDKPYFHCLYTTVILDEDGNTKFDLCEEDVDFIGSLRSSAIEELALYVSMVMPVLPTRDELKNQLSQDSTR